jgi:hypothetical protein
MKKKTKIGMMRKQLFNDYKHRNNMNKTIAFILLVTMAVILIPSAYAQAEYEQPYLFTTYGENMDYTRMYAPKVACADDSPDMCIMVWYYLSSGGLFEPATGIWWRFTYDGWQSENAKQYLIAVDYTSNSLLANFINAAAYKQFALPFDVTYLNGQFWIGVDLGNTAGSNYYTITPPFGTPTLNYSKANIADGGFVGIMGKGTDSPEILLVRHDQVATRYAFGTTFYLYNGSVTSSTNIGTFSCFSGTDYVMARGFIAKSGLTRKYDILAVVKCGAGSFGSPITPNNMVYPDTRDASWYWDGSRLVYKRANQVRYFPTSDLVSLGGSQAIYTENSAVNESINFTDNDIADSKSTYVFYRIGNESVDIFGNQRLGIMAKQTPLRHLKIVYPTATDVNTHVAENVNVNAVLSCNTYPYTTVGSGQVIDLYTTCESNTLTLLASGSYKPSTASVTNISLSDDCGTTTVITSEYVKPYTLTVRTRDLINAIQIENVTVNIDGVVNTTDSNGITTIDNFLPAISHLFTPVPSTCNYDLSYSGSAKSVSIIATKTGYQTYTETTTFAPATIDDPVGDFETDYLIEMNPPSTELKVRALTTDNVEIESVTSSIQLSVEGSDTTYFHSSGTYYLQSISSELPSTFLLVDNRSTYPVNVTLVFYGQTYSQNVTVTTNQYKELIINLNVSSVNLPCETNLDCPESFCYGSYFRRSQGCVNNVCQYQSSICKSPSFCDAERGCFDAQGTATCEDDTECTNQSSCLTTKKSRAGLCGSSGLCIFKDLMCRGDCNITTGQCYETSLCLELGQLRERFLIQKTTQPLIEGVYTNVVDIDYYCGLENRGQRSCISGAVIQKDSSLVGVTTIPDNWENSVDINGNNIYYDIAIQCSDYCNVTYEYCQYGCNDESGMCLHAPTQPSGQMKSFIDSISQFWWTIFPNIFVSTFVWIFISVVSSAALGFGVGGDNSKGVIFIVSTMALIGGGSVIGIVVNWFGLVYIVLSGYVVWKTFRSQ